MSKLTENDNFTKKYLKNYLFSVTFLKKWHFWEIWLMVYGPSQKQLFLKKHWKRGSVWSKLKSVANRSTNFSKNWHFCQKRRFYEKSNFRGNRPGFPSFSARLNAPKLSGKSLKRPSFSKKCQKTIKTFVFSSKSLSFAKIGEVFFYRFSSWRPADPPEGPT